MSYKIQITVDAQLNKSLKARAKEMGLSVSSYSRLALLSVLPRKNNKLLDQALEDVKANHTEPLSLAEFNRQLDKLL